VTAEASTGAATDQHALAGPRSIKPAAPHGPHRGAVRRARPAPVPQQAV